MPALLKLTELLDDKPVRVTLDLEPALHRELVAYAEALGRQSGKTVEPAKLIAPMVQRFIASDRGFSRARRSASSSPGPREG